MYAFAALAMSVTVLACSPISTPTPTPIPAAATPSPTVAPAEAPTPSAPALSQAEIFGPVGGWIAQSGLIDSFVYIDETTHDTFTVIEGVFGFYPEDEPELYDLGKVGEPAFGPRMTSESRAALTTALDGSELHFIADWRSFVDGRGQCARFPSDRRALHLSAPMPHRDQGRLFLVALNIDNGICEGLTYVLEVGWTGAGFEVLRIVREGDWVAD